MENEVYDEVYYEVYYVNDNSNLCYYNSYPDYDMSKRATLYLVEQEIRIYKVEQINTFVDNGNVEYPATQTLNMNVTKTLIEIESNRFSKGNIINEKICMVLGGARYE